MNMIEEALMRELLKEVQELNKTLKVIAGNQERRESIKINGHDFAEAAQKAIHDISAKD